jgi:hypothetical protein
MGPPLRRGGSGMDVVVRVAGLLLVTLLATGCMPFSLPLPF